MITMNHSGGVLAAAFRPVRGGGPGDDDERGAPP